MTVKFPQNLISHGSISDKSIELLGSYANDKDIVQSFAYLFRKKPDISLQLDNFIETVELSSLHMDVWLKAIVIVVEWLKSNSKSANFFDVYSYIQCCGEGTNWEKKELLDSIVEYLQQFGFEKSFEYK